MYGEHNVKLINAFNTFVHISHKVFLMSVSNLTFNGFGKLKLFYFNSTGEPKLPVHLSGSMMWHTMGVPVNECTVNVGSDPHGHVTKVTYATLKVFPVWDFRTSSTVQHRCSTDAN
jgi:hypothetical protein